MLCFSKKLPNKITKELTVERQLKIFKSQRLKVLLFIFTTITEQLCKWTTLISTTQMFPIISNQREQFKKEWFGSVPWVFKYGFFG